jgi:hypothetical protein
MEKEKEFTYEMFMASMQELRESQADTDRKIKEVSKLVGGITKSLGEIAEETIYNVLEKDMTFGNVKFYDIYKNMKKKTKALNLEGEFDVVLENGNTIAIIEIKSKVRAENVYEFATTKLEIFRKLFPVYRDYKIMLGIGGVTFEDDAIVEAKKQGIGIIKAIGDKVEYYMEGMKIY